VSVNHYPHHCRGKLSGLGKTSLQRNGKIARKQEQVSNYTIVPKSNKIQIILTQYVHLISLTLNAPEHVYIERRQ